MSDDKTICHSGDYNELAFETARMHIPSLTRDNCPKKPNVQSHPRNVPKIFNFATKKQAPCPPEFRDKRINAVSACKITRLSLTAENTYTQTYGQIGTRERILRRFPLETEQAVCKTVTLRKQNT